MSGFEMSFTYISCIWITKCCELPFQCVFLVESLKQRSVNQSVNTFIPEGDPNVLAKKEKRRPQKLLSPKPTALSLARMVWNGPIFNMLCVLIRDLTWLSDAALCERSAQAENLQELKQHCESTPNWHCNLNSKCYINKKIHLINSR